MQTQNYFLGFSPQNLQWVIIYLWDLKNLEYMEI